MPRNATAPYSHNLVSALYAVRGLLETCLEGRQRGSRETLKRAHGQADQALRIARRIGVVSTPGEAPPNGRSHRARVSAVWGRVRTNLQQGGSLEGIEILERIPRDFPAVECHPRDLQEILYCLARNSAEALAGDGKLIIRVQFSFSTKEEAFATIQVADTGPGISESEIPSLFLPFYTTKPWKEGNGLGLYLARELVRRNHGQITVSSFKGLGTTFTLDFPLAKRPKTKNRGRF